MHTPRPHHLAHPLALALLGALAHGCFGADKLDDRVAEAWCEYHVACGEYPDRRTCMEATFDDADTRYLRAAIDEGRVIYHRAQARRCVRAIKGLECLRSEDIDAVLGDACDGIFEGQVLPEEPCMLSQECMGELSRCGISPGCGEACCVGVCRYIDGPMAIGEPCTATSTCVRGARCDQGTCAPLPGPGEPCASDPGSDACAAGAGCDYNTNTCARRGEPGAACTHDGACVADAVCVAGICAALADRGDPCEYETLCRRGADTCRDGRCQPRREPGDPCEYDGECVAYAYCHEGACVAYRGRGEACSDDYAGPQRCYDELYCALGECVRYDDESDDVLCPIPE